MNAKEPNVDLPKDAPERPPPVAQVVRRPTASRPWLSLILLLMITGLPLAWIWSSTGLHPPGIGINLRFQEGHGLSPGDKVRYRGIDVGEVVAVDLHPSLGGVQVKLLLSPSAKALAREGTQFWIERPQVSLTRVRGLETLVEGRHVAVRQGPEQAEPRHEFKGLEAPPLTDSIPPDALEITLQSQERFLLQPGTPVTYRGILVGRVVVVQLASDGLGVESRVVVDPEYHDLVREKTEFWVKYPMDFHLGFSGVDLNLGTLENFASGGVAFATPSTPGEPVRTGHRFSLNEEEPAKWRDWHPSLVVGKWTLSSGAKFPSLVRVVRVTPSRRFGMRRERRRSGWVLPLRSHQMLGPAELLCGDASPADSTPQEDGAWLELLGRRADPLPSPQEPPASGEKGEVADRGRLARLPLADDFFSTLAMWPDDQLRIAVEPEDVFLISGLDQQTLPIAAPRFSRDGDRWRLDPDYPLAEDWFGALVLARLDGKVVGMLLDFDGRPYVCPLTSAILAK